MTTAPLATNLLGRLLTVWRRTADGWVDSQTPVCTGWVRAASEGKDSTHLRVVLELVTDRPHYLWGDEAELIKGDLLTIENGYVDSAWFAFSLTRHPEWLLEGEAKATALSIAAGMTP